MAFSRRAGAVLAVVLAVSSIAARERVVAAVPQSAVLFAAVGLRVNLDRLEIGPVQASLRLEKDIRTLIVESEIANPRSEAAAPPLVRISVRDASGAALYTWTTSPGAKTVPAGGRIPIRARLTAPPAGQDVVVEFVRTPA